jgi:hypothetical protein
MIYFISSILKNRPVYFEVADHMESDANGRNNHRHNGSASNSLYASQRACHIGHPENIAGL